jgi:hypothetical protein
MRLGRARAAEPSSGWAAEGGCYAGLGVLTYMGRGRRCTGRARLYAPFLTGSLSYNRWHGTGAE